MPMPTVANDTPVSTGLPPLRFVLYVWDNDRGVFTLVHGGAVFPKGAKFYVEMGGSLYWLHVVYPEDQ